MSRLRQAVGLRSLAATAKPAGKKPVKAAKSSKAGFKQYRERNGLFYFKLQDEQGSTLLQSRGFKTPQEAGRVIGEMQQDPHEFVNSFADQLEPVDNQTALAAMKVLEALANATGDQ